MGEKTINKLFSLKLSLFKKRPKSPSKITKSLNKALGKLNGNDDVVETANVKIWKNLEHTRDTIFGMEGNPPSKRRIQKLAEELITSDVLHALIEKLSSVSFESKKSIAIIYKYFLQMPQIVNYLCSKPDILFTLLNGHGNPNIHQNSGSMLRESVNMEESLAKIILYSEDFYKIFCYVETSDFHISSDALITLKVLLTGHKKLCSDFLDKNYDKVFTNYTHLLTSENYVIRWQSLKLLSEILHDHTYIKIKNRFIIVPENLQIVMRLLRRNYRNIQLEAMNVLFIFVDNPDKPSEITKILLKHQSGVVKFLQNFGLDRPYDDGFDEHRDRLIEMLKDL